MALHDLEQRSATGSSAFQNSSWFSDPVYRIAYKYFDALDWLLQKFYRRPSEPFHLFKVIVANASIFLIGFGLIILIATGMGALFNSFDVSPGVQDLSALLGAGAVSYTIIVFTNALFDHDILRRGERFPKQSDQLRE